MSHLSALRGCKNVSSISRNIALLKKRPIYPSSPTSWVKVEALIFLKRIVKVLHLSVVLQGKNQPTYSWMSQSRKVKCCVESELSHLDCQMSQSRVSLKIWVEHNPADNFICILVVIHVLHWKKNNTRGVWSKHAQKPVCCVFFSVNTGILLQHCRTGQHCSPDGGCLLRRRHKWWTLPRSTTSTQTPSKII